MSAQSFTKERLTWLDTIAQDSRITPGAFRLAFIISAHINRETGDAWPGLDRLAEAMGMNERSVRRLVDELVNAGHIAKQRGGDGRPNRYRMQVSDRTNMSDQNVSRLDINVHSETNRPDICVQSEPCKTDQTGHLRPSDRTFVSLQTGHKCPPNSFIEPLEEPFEKDIYISC
jgi:DNA-binding MarR family transcriptional regulator